MHFFQVLFGKRREKNFLLNESSADVARFVSPENLAHYGSPDPKCYVKRLLQAVIGWAGQSICIITNDSRFQLSAEFPQIPHRSELLITKTPIAFLEKSRVLSDTVEEDNLAGAVIAALLLRPDRIYIQQGSKKQNNLTGFGLEFLISQRKMQKRLVKRALASSWFYFRVDGLGCRSVISEIEQTLATQFPPHVSVFLNDAVVRPKSL